MFKQLCNDYSVSLHSLQITNFYEFQKFQKPTLLNFEKNRDFLDLKNFLYFESRSAYMTTAQSVTEWSHCIRSLALVRFDLGRLTNGDVLFQNGMFWLGTFWLWDFLTVGRFGNGTFWQTDKQTYTQTHTHTRTHTSNISAPLMVAK